MHAFMAASPACAFHTMTASLLAVAANASRDRAVLGPRSWVNTPATKAITRITRSCMLITHLIFWCRADTRSLPVVTCSRTPLHHRRRLDERDGRNPHCLPDGDGGNT